MVPAVWSRRLPFVHDGSSTADGRLYGRSFADVYDQWYGDLHEPLVVARALRRHLGALGDVDQVDDLTPRLLELGSGSGRLAGPLAHMGFEVIALDISSSMQEHDRTPSRKIRADMSVLPVADFSADVVLIAYNTLLTLPAPDAQRRCIDECARVLAPGGLLVIESFIAETPTDGFITSLSTRAHHTDANGRVAIATTRSTENPDLLVGVHIELTADGVRSRPWQISYLSPDQLASAAAAAGLELESRTGDWEDRPFDSSATRYVAWFRRPATTSATQ